MIYSVRHQTQYRYSEPVSLCLNVLRLRPRDDAHQTSLDHALTISPTPVSRHDRLDFFGNHVSNISLQEPHSTLTIAATSRVRVAERLPLDLESSTPWEEVAQKLEAGGDPTSLIARQFVFDSPHVARSEELATYARRAFTTGRPILEAAMALTEQIYEDFTFASGETDVGTPIVDVLKTRRGVCQDFAHIQIGCLRSLGLAARYVSGYIATKPPPGRDRLAGADASHAWLSVFSPGMGWVNFDPTNGIVPTTQHLTVAWARDYHDLSPVRGIVLGGKSHWLEVAVDVIPQNVG